MATVQTPTIQFKVGEIVIFKTTEIRMIVTQIKEDQIQCWYYNKVTGGMEKHFFPSICLKKVSAPVSVSPR